VLNIRAGLCAFRVWLAPCVREHLGGEHHGLQFASVLRAPRESRALSFSRAFAICCGLCAKRPRRLSRSAYRVAV
jgi:hypothetical protein